MSQISRAKPYINPYLAGTLLGIVLFLLMYCEMSLFTEIPTIIFLIMKSCLRFSWKVIALQKLPVPHDILRKLHQSC